MRVLGMQVIYLLTTDKGESLATFDRLYPSCKLGGIVTTHSQLDGVYSNPGGKTRFYQSEKPLLAHFSSFVMYIYTIHTARINLSQST